MLATQLAALCCLLFVAPAQADAGAQLEAGAAARAPDPGVAQTEELRRAENAERQFEFAKALSSYSAAVALNPTSRLARRARTRADWIRARSEGDFKPLVSLSRVQQRGTKSTEAELRQFEQRTSGFPQGRVRRESRALIATAYLQRFKSFEAAVSAHQAWLAEPGLSRAEREMATRGLALSRAGVGDLGGSLDTLKGAGLSHTAENALLRVASLRRFAAPLAWSLLALFVGLGAYFGGYRGFVPEALSGALSWRRLLVAAYALGPPLLLAEAHDRETLTQVAKYVPAALGLLLLASIFDRGLSRSAASDQRRRWLALAGVAAQIAACYLVVDGSGALLGVLISWNTR